MSTFHQILVLVRDGKEFQGKLSRLNLPNAHIIIPASERELEEGLQIATILLADPPLAHLCINRLPHLQWMQSTFAGVDGMIKPHLRTDYILTNVKETYGECMAEYVLAYILFFEREIDYYLHLQKEKLWKMKPYGTLTGKRLGILGAGSIGQAIARIAKAFHMTTCGYRTSESPVPFFDEIYTHYSQKEFFKECDYLINVLPLTSATRNFVNKEIFSLVKPECVFMNIGRGATVDSNALVEALNNKVLRAAVIDVFPEEPLAQESPLWATPNLFITPHVSGYQISDRIFEIFEQNYQRFISKQPLLHQIDFLKGY